jgi:hypothetical protein
VCVCGSTNSQSARSRDTQKPGSQHQPKQANRAAQATARNLLLGGSSGRINTVGPLPIQLLRRQGGDRPRLVSPLPAGDRGITEILVAIVAFGSGLGLGAVVVVGVGRRRRGIAGRLAGCGHRTEGRGRATAYMHARKGVRARGPSRSQAELSPGVLSPTGVRMRRASRSGWSYVDLLFMCRRRGDCPRVSSMREMGKGTWNAGLLFANSPPLAEPSRAQPREPPAPYPTEHPVCRGGGTGGTATSKN